MVYAHENSVLILRFSVFLLKTSYFRIFVFMLLNEQVRLMDGKTPIL